MTNRTQAPNILDAVELDLQLKPVQQFTLDNQVPVYAIDAQSPKYNVCIEIEYFIFKVI